MLLGRSTLRPLTAAAAFNFSAHKDNFMSGQNANYIDYMYSAWQRDPTSVNASWQAFFSSEDFSQAPGHGQKRDP